MKCHRRIIGASREIFLVSSCGSEPDEGFFGTYVLVGVEGSQLPYLARSDADCDEFISEDELTLAETGTYNLECSGLYDCSRGEGQTGTLGRLYTGTFSQDGGRIVFEAEIQGAGTLEFSGSVNPLEATVTVPAIPPQTGPDLGFQSAAQRR